MDEPRSIEEVLGMNDSESQKIVREEEMKALKKNDTWALVPFSKECKYVSCK